jgi:hypothetical protein
MTDEEDQPGRHRRGVGKSLARRGCGPVGLVHTHKARIQYGKPTCVSCITRVVFNLQLALT